MTIRIGIDRYACSRVLTELASASTSSSRSSLLQDLLGLLAPQSFPDPPPINLSSYHLAFPNLFSRLADFFFDLFKGSVLDADLSSHKVTEASSKASTVLEEFRVGAPIRSSPVRSIDSTLSKLTLLFGNGAGRGVGRGVKPFGSLVDVGLEGVPNRISL